MKATPLVFLWLVSLGVTDSDPAAMVRRLGAAKYAEREAASAAIEKLGPEALPALRAARAVSDAEVRSRAVALVERIENDLMVKPTPVVLDFRDITLGQAIAKLAERGHVNLVLSPVAASFRDRKVTLVRPESVPFWEAVDALGVAGGVELSGGLPVQSQNPGSLRATTLSLIPSPPGSTPAPVSISGPFRLSLLNITHNKERNYGGPSGMIAMPANQVGFAPIDLPRPADGAIGGEQFYAGLQVLAEPRMAVSLNGLPRLTVALDEFGNSLLPSSPSNNGFVHNSGYNQFESSGSVALQMTVGLRFPENAGKTIKTLRGVVPLVITARKGDPLLIPLADGKGKTYHNADATVTIHDVKADPNFGQSVVDLTIRNRQLAEPGFNGFVPNFPSARGASATQNPFEIVDAQGRSYSQWHLLSQNQTPDGLRISIRMLPAVTTGPPTHIRYYELSRVTTDAEFQFHDVDMP